MQIKKEEGNSVGGKDRNFGLGIFVFATLLFESRVVDICHARLKSTIFLIHKNEDYFWAAKSPKQIRPQKACKNSISISGHGEM